MSDKLNIANEMRCLDSKNREFYDSLTEEERKKFSTYLMIRWATGVQDPALQEYYLLVTNKRLNKHFFELNKHPKLQWLLATTISPGEQAIREEKIFFPPKHNWIAPKKKEKGDNEIKKTLMDLYPTMKTDEINMLSKMITKKELKELMKDLGNDK